MSPVSGRPSPRWQGVEIEYAVAVAKGPVRPEVSLAARLLESIATADAAPGEQVRDHVAGVTRGGRVWPSRGGFFLRSGGRMYLDTVRPWDELQTILEGCTPECPDAASLLRYERAMDESLAGALDALTDGPPPGHVYRAAVVQTPWSTQGTVGLHESYTVAAERLDGVVEALVPYLCVRQLLCGTGGFHEGRYCVSPRQFFVRQVMSERVPSDHPLVSSGNADYSAPGSRRLQVANGEAARGELTTFLRQSVTAAVIDAASHGTLGPLAPLADPLATARALSASPFGPWPLELADGTTVGALDYLEERYLAPCLETAAPGSPAERGLRTALEVLALLRSGALDPGTLSVDWLVKRAIFSGARDLSGAADEPRRSPDGTGVLGLETAQAVDNAYRALTDDVFAAIEASWPLLRLTTEDEVAASRAAPPPASRAEARLAVLERFGERITHLDWHEATVGSRRLGFEQLDGWTAREIARLVDGT